MGNALSYLKKRKLILGNLKNIIDLKHICAKLKEQDDIEENIKAMERDLKQWQFESTLNNRMLNHFPKKTHSTNRQSPIKPKHIPSKVLPRRHSRRIALQRYKPPRRIDVEMVEPSAVPPRFDDVVHKFKVSPRISASSRCRKWIEKMPDQKLWKRDKTLSGTTLLNTKTKSRKAKKQKKNEIDPKMLHVSARLAPISVLHMYDTKDKQRLKKSIKKDLCQSKTKVANTKGKTSGVRNNPNTKKNPKKVRFTKLKTSLKTKKKKVATKPAKQTRKSANKQIVPQASASAKDIVKQRKARSSTSGSSKKKINRIAISEYNMLPLESESALSYTEESEVDDMQDNVVESEVSEPSLAEVPPIRSRVGKCYYPREYKPKILKSQSTPRGVSKIPAGCLKRSRRAKKDSRRNTNGVCDNQNEIQQWLRKQNRFPKVRDSNKIFARKHRPGLFLSRRRGKPSLAWAILQIITIMRKRKQMPYPLLILKKLRNHFGMDNITLCKLNDALRWMVKKKILTSEATRDKETTKFQFKNGEEVPCRKRMIPKDAKATGHHGPPRLKFAHNKSSDYVSLSSKKYGNYHMRRLKKRYRKFM